MVTTLDVRKFILSNNYMDLLDNVTTRLSIPLRKSEIPSQVFNIDANCINKAGVDLSILSELCLSDKEAIVRFIELHKSEIGLGDEGGKDETIEVLPSYKNFLVGYLIKYFFVSKRPEMLESYLKSLKIPAYKKHSDELIGIYNKI